MQAADSIELCWSDRRFIIIIPMEEKIAALSLLSDGLM